MKHYITKCVDNGKFYAESWLQINAFGRAFCFSQKRIELPDEMGKLEKQLEDFEKWCKDERKSGVHFVLDCVIPNLDG